jgi:hypothetical protein
MRLYQAWMARRRPSNRDSLRTTRPSEKVPALRRYFVSCAGAWEHVALAPPVEPFPTKETKR